MTADCLADSCVAAKWVLTEADSAKAIQVVTDVAVAGRKLFTLDFAAVEVANVIRTRVRRKLITAAEAATAFAKLRARPTADVAAMPLLSVAFDLALKYDLAVYDALFVAAVQHLDCDGVTSDEPLHKAVAADFPRIKLLKDW